MISVTQLNGLHYVRGITTGLLNRIHVMLTGVFEYLSKALIGVNRVCVNSLQLSLSEDRRRSTQTEHNINPQGHTSDTGRHRNTANSVKDYRIGSHLAIINTRRSRGNIRQLVDLRRRQGHTGTIRIDIRVTRIITCHHTTIRTFFGCVPTLTWIALSRTAPTRVLHVTRHNAITRTHQVMAVNITIAGTRGIFRHGLPARWGTSEDDLSHQLNVSRRRRHLRMLTPIIIVLIVLNDNLDLLNNANNYNTNNGLDVKLLISLKRIYRRILRFNRILIPTHEKRNGRSLLSLRITQYRLLTRRLNRNLYIGTIILTTPDARCRLLTTGLVTSDGRGTGTITRNIGRNVITRTMLLTDALNIKYDNSSRINVNVRVLTLRTRHKRRRHAITMRLAISITTAILTMPFALLVRSIMRVQVNTRHNLLTRVALGVSATQVNGQNGNRRNRITRLHVTTAIVRSYLHNKNVGRDSLKRSQDKLLDEHKLDFNSFLNELLSKLKHHLNLKHYLSLNDLHILSILNSLLFKNRDDLGLNLRHHRGTNKRTIGLTGANGQALSVLNTNLKRDRRVTLNNLNANLTLKVKLAHSIKPTIAIPIISIYRG